MYYESILDLKKEEDEFVEEELYKWKKARYKLEQM